MVRSAAITTMTLASIATASSHTVNTASTQESDAVAAVHRYMAAESSGDMAGLVTMRSGINLDTMVEQDSQGAFRVTRRGFDPAARALDRSGRYGQYMVLARKGFAVVWIPYEAERNDTSYCGVHAFELVKDHGAWLVVSVASTIERYDCQGGQAPASR